MNRVIVYGNSEEAVRKAFTDEQIGSFPIYLRDSFMDHMGEFGGTEVILATWTFPTFTVEELERWFPNLRAFFYAAGSVRRFAPAMYERGIRVYSGWRANAVPVAEWASSMIILANKGFFRMHEDYSTHGSERAARNADSYDGNYGTRVGLIGCGMIGTHVAELLSMHDLDVVVYDPYITDEKAERLGVTRVGLEELFETSQTVSNHLPDLPSTRGMLDYHLFSRMKKNATFINTARGREVVEEDLVRALREEPSRMAILDVTDPREPLETADPLFREKNIILTPHRAGALMGEIRRLGEYVFGSYQGWKEGVTGDPNEVTPEMLEKMA